MGAKRVVSRIGLSSQVPPLRPGEMGYDTDTKVFRVGDDTADAPKVLTDKTTFFDLSNLTDITLSEEVLDLIAKRGVDGWSPVIKTETSGQRELLVVKDWIGDGLSSDKPPFPVYIGSNGFTEDSNLATDIRGRKGDDASGPVISFSMENGILVMTVLNKDETQAPIEGVIDENGHLILEYEATNNTSVYTDLGKVLVTFKGNYSNYATYYALDEVIYSEGLYRVNYDVTSVTGINPSDTDYWSVVFQKIALTWSATVDDISGRGVYDSEPEGFSVLVLDTGNTTSAVYFRVGAVGNWSNPLYITSNPGLVWIEAGWSSGTNYYRNDALENGGSSYRCIVDHVSAANTEPGVGVNWEDNWALIAYSGDITSHINDHNNPHNVTKAQLGLGNVDNTSDLDKPISTATQNALNSKFPTPVGDTSQYVRGNGSLGNISVFATSAQGAKADSAVQPGDLEVVATTGSYNDLIDKPVLGTAAFANTNQFATSSQGAKADSAVQSIVQGNNGIVVNSTDPYNPVISFDTPDYILNADYHVDGANNKVMTAAERTKLEGIEEGAKTGDMLVSIYDPDNNNANSFDLSNQYGDKPTEFTTVADLLANASLGYSAARRADQVASGDIITAQGFRYEVAASGATDAHVETAGGVKLYVLGDSVALEAVGVDMTGTATDTVRVQMAFDAAASRGVGVTCGTGAFKSGTITVAAGVGHVDLQNAEWIGGAAMTTAPRLKPTERPAKNGRRYSVNMNMANGDLIGIEGLLCDSDFGGVHIYGYVNHALLNHVGIRPQAGSDNCDYRGYKWEGYDNPTQRGIGVHCTATVAPYGGYFPSGILARATIPVTNQRIHGATFIGGSYAWVANGTEFSTFAGNYCDGQNHRVIQFTAGCYRCTSSGNMFKDFKSSAVLFSFGSTECSSFDDTVDLQTYASGEAAFNINSGAVGTHVLGAKGYSATNFGVYVSTGASKTIVDGCKLEGFYIGGVVVQSDWANPADPNRSALFYDRSNYAPPSDLDPAFTKWAFADLDGIIISNNRVGNGYPGRNTVGYGVIQMDSVDGASVYDARVTLTGNAVHDTTRVTYDLVVWKESGECRLRLKGNDFRANGFKSGYAGATVNWSDFIEEWSDNGEFDQLVLAEGISLTGSTPSVSTPAPDSVAQIFKLVYTTATDVTNFINGFNGQSIRIWGHVNATLKHNSGLMRLKDSVDTTPNSNQMIELTRRGDIWFETGRSY